MEWRSAERLDNGDELSAHLLGVLRPTQHDLEHLADHCIRPAGCTDVEGSSVRLACRVLALPRPDASNVAGALGCEPATPCVRCSLTERTRRDWSFVPGGNCARN